MPKLDSHLSTAWTELVRQVAARELQATATRIWRSRTGLSHFVFVTETEAHDTCVIRLARPERRAELEDGLYWHSPLSELGLPLPSILATGQIRGYAYAVYERLPGDDLESVYATLSAAQRARIAGEVADVQRKIATLQDPRLEDMLPWPEVISLILSRSEREIHARGESAPAAIARARQLFTVNEQQLSALRPVPFLYDIGLRNVLIVGGAVSGIIDIDEMWFGDPVLAIGRSKTLLLLMQEQTDFIDAWCDALYLDTFARRRVEWYALLYCIRFLGTSGLVLNGNYSVQTDARLRPRLASMTQGLLEKLT